tara:strand:+ start:951 stop:1262 length:312 start_codon:yes stop_codon:yes gene_type:complete
MLDHFQKSISFPLKAVYLFHAIFSTVICVLFLFLAKTKKFKDQLGFIYLGTLFLKIIFFAIIFHNLIFNNLVLSTLERVSLLIPVVLFLSFEVLFVSKILKRL